MFCAPILSRPRLGTLLATGMLAGCGAVGPDYTPPPAPAPVQWHAPVPHDGSVAALDAWWQRFDDPALGLLLRQAEQDSPTLESAAARIDAARATLASARAGGRPSVTGQYAATRAGEKGNGGQVTRTASLDASWELDLFGKVRRSTQAAQARVQARQDDWHDARISLAAEVADTYVQYRGCLLLADAYGQELESTRRTLRATAALVRAGLDSAADEALARASAASAASSLLGQTQDCELLVKTLTQLTGLAEPALRAALAHPASPLPRPAALAVPALPADVLRQRPDVAALERELAAASAEIGVAQAALLPSVSLGGTLSGTPSLTSWSFGPSLSLPLFDGGSGRAGVDSARASFFVASAAWRSGVRQAVADVEQALVRLDGTQRREAQARESALQYQRYFLATEAEWRAGTQSLLTLEDARRQSLDAQVTLAALERDHVRYWIALYKAIGGGWQDDTPAIRSAPLSRP